MNHPTFQVIWRMTVSTAPSLRKLLIMRRLTLIFASCIASRAASQEINVSCREIGSNFPPSNSTSPSLLADLKVELVTVGQQYMMNISWAINIDASTRYLEGTRIDIHGDSIHHCSYVPPLAKANLSGLQQKWFHYLIKGSYGFTLIQAANLPLPPPNSGLAYRKTNISIPKVQQNAPKTTQVPMADSTVVVTTPQDPTEELTKVLVNGNSTSIMVAIFGGLTSLMILTSCYIVYRKNCGAMLIASAGFKTLPTSPKVAVPVLMVYPAENLAFQRAVMALAEFLQLHGGCSVAVDMWQQGKIAELGPIRWLAEQAKAADRVLIVCPQGRTPSVEHSNSAELSIPAAAHDLYPLILNMVASHSKSASDLAKFWVVQFGNHQMKRPSNLPLELGACKNFCLMKDMFQLCRGLHDQKQNDKKTFNLNLKQEMEKSTMNLREAIEKLGTHQPSNYKEGEVFISVATTV